MPVASRFYVHQFQVVPRVSGRCGVGVSTCIIVIELDPAPAASLPMADSRVIVMGCGLSRRCRMPSDWYQSKVPSKQSAIAVGMNMIEFLGITSPRNVNGGRTGLPFPGHVQARRYRKGQKRPAAKASRHRRPGHGLAFKPEIFRDYTGFGLAS